MYSAIWLPITYVLMSFIEWALHKFPMHSRRFVGRTGIGGLTFERHAVLHHGRFFRVFDQEPDIAAKHISFVLNPIENMIGLLPLSALIWLIDPIGAYIFTAFVGLHAIAWTAIHSEMHLPRGRWFAKNRLFTFLRDYHKTHHDWPGKNFNILCLGADHVFGTYRRNDDGRATGAENV